MIRPYSEKQLKRPGSSHKNSIQKDHFYADRDESERL